MRNLFDSLFLFMSRTSKLVLFAGLPYHEVTLVSGVQTIRPDWAGPVSVMLGGEVLTGCFYVRPLRNPH